MTTEFSQSLSDEKMRRWVKTLLLEFPRRDLTGWSRSILAGEKLFQ
jgi:hypothetical protein